MTNNNSNQSICGFCKSTNSKILYKTFDIFENNYTINKCNDCNAYFLAPRPSSERLAQAYDSSYYGEKEEKFSSALVEKILDYFRSERSWKLSQYLNNGAKVLDVGCGKGFMLHDMALLIPGITVKGIDISKYAIANTMDDMKPHVQVANVKKLPFPDKSFDVVIAINTIHNLEKKECGQALKEIERVSRGKSFITVDAYRNDEEKELMFAWNLTAKTIMHVDEWIAFFKEVGYSGDYFWFIP